MSNWTNQINNSWVSSTFSYGIWMRQYNKKLVSSQIEFHIRGSLKRIDLPTGLMWRLLCRDYLFGMRRKLWISLVLMNVNIICVLALYISIHKKCNFKYIYIYNTFPCNSNKWIPATETLLNPFEWDPILFAVTLNISSASFKIDILLSVGMNCYVCKAK